MKTERKNLFNPLRPLLQPALICSILSGALVAGYAGQEAVGNVQGRVTFDGGTAPKGIKVTDAVVCLVGDGLADKSVASKPGAAAVLDQQDITFVPHVLPVLAGTKVEIRNSDAILHNVHTASQKNPAFNRPQLAHQTMEVTFAAPEIIHVGCDVHSQMSAYIVVAPTPYFTKTAKDGTFTLTDIPPGKYRLVTWHENYEVAKTPVEIIAGKLTETEVNLTKTSNTANR